VNEQVLHNFLIKLQKQWSYIIHNIALMGQVAQGLVNFSHTLSHLFTYGHLQVRCTIVTYQITQGGLSFN